MSKYPVMPEGIPVSLRKLQMDGRIAEINEQIKEIKRTNPDLSVTRPKASVVPYVCEIKKGRLRHDSLTWYR